MINVLSNTWLSGMLLALFEYLKLLFCYFASFCMLYMEFSLTAYSCEIDIWFNACGTWARGCKTFFSFSTQLGMKFIPLTDIKIRITLTFSYRNKAEREIYLANKY